MGGEEGCGCGGVGDGGGVGEESVDGGSGEAAMGGRVGSGCDLRTDTEKKQTMWSTYVMLLQLII